jgi:general secretion pathway protein B
MSYILEALKKSQEERELGQVPTLDGLPNLYEQRPARSIYWVIVAVVLALLAVLIALYAAFGARLLQENPEVAGSSLGVPTNTPEAVPPTEPVTAPKPGASVPPKPPAVAKPAPKPGPAVTEQPSERPQPKPAPVRPVSIPEPASATPTESTLHMPPLTPAIPPDLVGEVQRFKQKILQEGEGARERAEYPVPAPGPDLTGEVQRFKQELLQEGEAAERGAEHSAPTQVPGPVRELPHFEQEILPEVEATEESEDYPVLAEPAAPEPTVLDEIETLPDETQAEPQPMAPPPALVDESTPELYDLSPEYQAGIPPHRLSVHVYGSDPAQRFVILNSRKMREGDSTAEGLALEKITIDGVILEYSGKRFFVDR